MTSWFASPAMATGYARARPPVHPRVAQLIGARLGIAEPVGLALDVGCGAGLSSVPLMALARRVVGIDPVPAMVRAAAEVTSPGPAPSGPAFAAGAAEAIPLRSGSVDLLCAAGSLDFVDVARFLPEARRALRPAGRLVVYDFSSGRRFPDSPALESWFNGFRIRYPAVVRAPLDLSVTPGFRRCGHEEYAVELMMDPDAYVAYLMTETNVAAAIGRGTSPEDVRSWCVSTLAPVFRGAARPVIFTGYLTWFEPEAPAQGG